MERNELFRLIEKYALVDPDEYGEEARKNILNELVNIEIELEKVHVLLKETIRKFK